MAQHKEHWNTHVHFPEWRGGTAYWYYVRMVTLNARNNDVAILVYADG
jgi:hypothetical protein